MVWTTVMFIGRPEDGEQCGIQSQLVGVGNHKWTELSFVVKSKQSDCYPRLSDSNITFCFKCGKQILSAKHSVEKTLLESPDI